VLKSFQYQGNLAQINFKSGGLCVVNFSIDNYSSATYFADFKNGEICSSQFESSCCSSNRSKGYELATIQRLCANLKAFGAKRLGYDYFKKILKGQ
jgi:hypothetical protein